jgi:hypothetical protein
MNEWIGESPRLASGSGDNVYLSMETLLGNMGRAPLLGILRERQQEIY